MKPRKRSYEMDMTNGPLLGKLVRFAIPLGLSGILQLLFNAADIVVVGRFAGSGALAAVGSTGALINLIVNLFIGLSVGTNVLAAQYYGAGNRKDLQETVHTSVLTSLIFGVVLLVIGISLADPLLALMGTPEEVLPQASLYMRIFFLGMPASMLYNFGAAILRAVGDTKRPLYFLLLSGVVNVVLNLFFVIVLHMDVAGVATATVISQAISAGLVVWCLVKVKGDYNLDLKKLRIYKDKLLGTFFVMKFLTFFITCAYNKFEKEAEIYGKRSQREFSNGPGSEAQYGRGLRRDGPFHDDRFHDFCKESLARAPHSV